MTLLRRCLEKHAPKRLPHIGVARLELEAPLTGARRGLHAVGNAAAEARPHRRPGVGRDGRGSGGRYRRRDVVGIAERARGAASIYRSTLLIPSEQSLIGNAPSNRFALSPDARHLAYVGMNGQTRQLWLRALDGTTAQPVAGTRGASSPFWSPDSRYVAFFAEGKLLKVDGASGPAGDDRRKPVLCPERQRHLGYRQRDHRRLS